MINTQQQALELAKVYGVNPSEHPSAVVTENGNVYLTDNIDPKDTGKRFYLNIEEAEAEVIEDELPKKGRKKQS